MIESAIDMLMVLVAVIIIIPMIYFLMFVIGRIVDLFEYVFDKTTKWKGDDVL